MIRRWVATYWMWIAAVLMAASLFGFVDKHYRGWWDTNQYQIEAKLWSKGERPPSPAISYSFDLPLGVGPRHTTPLMPFVWGKIASPDSWRDSLFRIRVLQVLLIGFCSLGLFAWLRRKDRSAGSLLVVLLLFTNSFFRDLVEGPLTEPLALSLWVGSLLWPPFVGIALVLEMLVRPMILVLFVPILLRSWRSKWIWSSAVITAAVCVLFFGSLVKGSPANDMRLEFWKFFPVFDNFAQDAGNVIFSGLHHGGSVFYWVWRACLAASVIYLITRYYRRIDVWVCAVIYYLMMMVPLPISGVRYGAPLVLFLVAELSLTVPKRRAIRVIVSIFVLFMVGHRFEQIRDFWRLNEPDTDTPSLRAAHSWLSEHQLAKATLLMPDYRFCINFFDTRCIPEPLMDQGVQSYLIQHQVDFLMFSGEGWNVGERNVDHRMKEELTKIGYDYDGKSTHFGIAKLVDVRPLTHTK